jgi:GAF domain-containing protein
MRPSPITFDRKSCPSTSAGGAAKDLQMTRIRPGPSGVDGLKRLHQLALAQSAMISELSMDAVLETVVRAARDVLGAEYGALALLDANENLEHILAHGDDGVMQSSLEMPVRHDGVTIGRLYVADPEPGRFDESEAELLDTLASTAGAAIANARRHTQLACSRDWLTASGAITRALLAEPDDDVLPDVASRALAVAGADYAGLIMPIEDGRLRVAAAEGVGADDYRGLVFDPAGSPLGRSITATLGACTPDMTSWASDDFDNPHQYGPAMIAPLVHAHGSRGAMLLMRTARKAPFSATDLELASMFAAQVAVALELNDARAEAERLRVMEDRNRIAHELHDNVIQRLFAVGVGLQALLEQPLDGLTAQRLGRHIADLDETIDEIRSRIFGLQDNDGLPDNPEEDRL